MKAGLGLCSLLYVLAARLATAADWQMDADGSQLEFVTRIQNAPVTGEFKSFHAQLAHFALGALTGARLDVSIDTTSADMHATELNDTIKDPLWLDFAHYPTAVFHSASIERTDADHFLAHGELELKGVRQPIDVPFAWQQANKHAVMRGELLITRSDFGIGSGEWASTETVGGTVHVHFNVGLSTQD